MTLPKFPPESAPSILTLAAQVIARHPGTIGTLDPSTSYYTLCPSVCLPSSATESILSAAEDSSGPSASTVDNNFLNLFTNGTFMPIQHLNLEGSPVTNAMAIQLLQGQRNNLKTLNLSDCQHLSSDLNDEIGRCNVILPKLELLHLGSSLHLFKRWKPHFASQRSLSNAPSVEAMECDGEEPDWMVVINAEGERSLPQAASSSAEDNLGDRAVRSSTPHHSGLTTDFRACSSLSTPAESACGAPSTSSTSVAPNPLNSNVSPSNQTEPRRSKSSSQPNNSESSCSDNLDMMTPPATEADLFSGCLDSSVPMLTESMARSADEQPTCSQLKAFSGSLTHMCPNLRALSIFGSKLDDVFPEFSTNQASNLCLFFEHVLEPLKGLLYLDISYWTLQDLRFLLPLSRLTSLILYDVPDLYRCIDVIKQLNCLSTLDISQTERDSGQYPRPVTTLHSIVVSLPYLLYLDISSTNLASHPAEGGDDWPIDKGGHNSIPTDIIGLRGLRCELNFLGLYNCDTASSFKHLPAKEVSGDTTEDQILVALERYLLRPGLIRQVLSDTYTAYRHGETRNCPKALDLILRAMERHANEVNIQVSGSAALFYVMKEVDCTCSAKRRIIRVFLRALKIHTEESVLVRNCCLSLCQFEIPNDLMFAYTEAVELLLKILRKHRDDIMTQRIVVYLLNSMACMVDGDQKIQVGQLYAVEEILQLIERRESSGICDEVMEVSWSFLWNITDETPINCQRFLDSGGMALFQRCFNRFPTKNELLRNMMGLMGNIAEVRSLRGRLLNTDNIEAFLTLLNNLNDGIEISYNSGGVLSHLCSDGEEGWRLDKPTRDEVMKAIKIAIGQWVLESKRYINYRSFEPIFRLVPMYDCPAAQHWAIWALANLTTVDRKKYCKFVIRENGVKMLEDIQKDPRPDMELRKLAHIILENIRKWREDLEKSGRTEYDGDSEDSE